MARGFIRSSHAQPVPLLPRGRAILVNGRPDLTFWLGRPEQILVNGQMDPLATFQRPKAAGMRRAIPVGSDYGSAATTFSWYCH
jgi:hypothetical protein